MSKPEDKARSVNRDGSAFKRLEGAVDGAVAQLKELKARLGQTQDENREMKELLRRFTEGEEDPARMMTRLGELEVENRELLDRLKIGKEGVERLLARIRFLEEQG